MYLRFVLLALLNNEADTGYGLGRALNDEVKHLWDTTLQQIYGELRAMRTAGLTEQQIVALSNGREKKIYSITPQGQAELQRWLTGPVVAQRQKDSLPMGILAILNNITEQKRLEEQLRSAREELEGKVGRQMLRKNPYGLTFRQLTVLHLVVAGRSDKEIAAELVLSPQTVHKHVANILAKMAVSSRTAAATRALREGLLE